MKFTYRILFLFIITISGHTCYGQFTDNLAQGARSIGIGGNGVCLTGIDAMRSNQAGLTSLNSWGIGLHTESRYLLSEIHTIGLDIATPTKYGIFGLSLNSFGNSSYSEQKIGIAYARKLFKKLSIGAQFDFLNTSIQNYGSKINYTFEIGIYSEIFHNLHAAAHIYSPLKTEITEVDPIAARLRFGLKFIMSDKLNILGEFDKNINDKHNLKFGLEYRIVKQLQLRTGIGTREGSFSFGLSYYYKKFGIDFGVVQHAALGTSPALSLRYGVN